MAGRVDEEACPGWRWRRATAAAPPTHPHPCRRQQLPRVRVTPGQCARACSPAAAAVIAGTRSVLSAAAAAAAQQRSAAAADGATGGRPYRPRPRTSITASLPRQACSMRHRTCLQLAGCMALLCSQRMQSRSSSERAQMEWPRMCCAWCAVVQACGASSCRQGVLMACCWSKVDWGVVCTRGDATCARVQTTAAAVVASDVAAACLWLPSQSRLGRTASITPHGPTSRPKLAAHCASPKAYSDTRTESLSANAHRECCPCRQAKLPRDSALALRMLAHNSFPAQVRPLQAATRRSSAGWRSPKQTPSWSSGSSLSALAATTTWRISRQRSLTVSPGRAADSHTSIPLPRGRRRPLALPPRPSSLCPAADVPQILPSKQHAASTTCTSACGKAGHACAGTHDPYLDGCARLLPSLSARTGTVTQPCRLPACLPVTMQPSSARRRSCCGESCRSTWHSCLSTT